MKKIYIIFILFSLTSNNVVLSQDLLLQIDTIEIKKIKIYEDLFVQYFDVYFSIINLDKKNKRLKISDISFEILDETNEKQNCCNCISKISCARRKKNKIKIDTHKKTNIRLTLWHYKLKKGEYKIKIFITLKDSKFCAEKKFIIEKELEIKSQKKAKITISGGCF